MSSSGKCHRSHRRSVDAQLVRGVCAAGVLTTELGQNRTLFEAEHLEPQRRAEIRRPTPADRVVTVDQRLDPAGRTVGTATPCQVSAQHGGNTWPVTDAVSIWAHPGARVVVGVVTMDVVVEVGVVVVVEVDVVVVTVTSAVASGTASGSDPQETSARIRRA